MKKYNHYESMNNYLSADSKPLYSQMVMNLVKDPNSNDSMEMNIKGIVLEQKLYESLYNMVGL